MHECAVALLEYLPAFATLATRDAVLQRLVTGVVELTHQRGVSLTTHRRRGGPQAFGSSGSSTDAAPLEIVLTLGGRARAHLRVDRGPGFDEVDESLVRLLAGYAEAALLRVREREERRRARVHLRRVRIEAEQRAERTHRLEHAGFQLARAATHELPQAIAEIAAELLGAGCAAVVAVADDEHLELLASVGCGDAGAGHRRLLERAAPLPLAAAVRTDDFVVSQGYLGLGGGEPAEDAVTVCAPLHVDGAAIGAIGLTLPGRRALARADRELLAGYADVAAQVLDRAQRSRLFDRGQRLRALTDGLVEAATPHEIAQAIVQQGVAALGASAGTIVLLTTDGKGLELAATAGYPPGRAFHGFPLDAPVPLADAARERRDVVLESDEAAVAAYPALETRESYERGALVALPLAIGEASLGAIAFTFAENRSFDAEDREFMRALAHLCSQAVDRAQRIRLHDRAARLHSIAAALSRASTASEVADVIVAEGIHALGARGGSVAIRGPDGESLTIIATLGDPTTLAAAWERLPITAPTPIAEAVRTGEPVLLRSIADVDARYPGTGDLFRLTGDTAVAALPLRLGDVALGGIALTFAEEHEFPDEDVRFLTTLADLCAQALDRARLTDVEHISNERRGRLLERLEDGVVLVTPDLTIEVANSTALALIGLSDRSARQPLPDPWPSCSLRQLALSLLRPNATGTEQRVETPDGAILDVVGIADETAPVIVLRDVTRRERQERAEREFVANAAHELRTPLAAMAAALDALRLARDDATRDRFLNGVAAQTTRMTKLVHALLALARAQANPRALPTEPIQLAPLLRSIANGLDVRPAVRVVFDCPSELMVVGDRALVEATLRNLAENASRHTERGQISLTATQAGERAVIEVRDSGAGIGPGAQAHVFDRFYRAEPEAGHGFGLGLPLAREMVRALGGEIQLESRPGLGTTLRVILRSAE